MVTWWSVYLSLLMRLPMPSPPSAGCASGGPQPCGEHVKAGCTDKGDAGPACLKSCESLHDLQISRGERARLPLVSFVLRAELCHQRRVDPHRLSAISLCVRRAALEPPHSPARGVRCTPLRGGGGAVCRRGRARRSVQSFRLGMCKACVRLEAASVWGHRC